MNTTYVKLSWENIEQYCSTISESIIKSKIIPDVIISIGRGGMIPARILSDKLSIKQVYMYNIKLYTGVNTRQAKPTLESFTGNVEKKNILLVDDIMDTGLTIEAVLNDIRTKRVVTSRVATLLCKKSNIRKPTFYAAESEENEWIIFPWEKKEFLSQN
jgi:hypoxanthine phosphoribosyltransferase